MTAKRRVTTRLALLAALLLPAAPAVAAAETGGAPPRHPDGAWSAGWTTSLQPPVTAFEQNWSEEGFADQTVRQVVRVTGSGTKARIRLSNRYGSEPLDIESATIARTDPRDRSAVLGEPAELTFGGDDRLTVPPGAERTSDATRLRLAAGRHATVTLHVGDPSGPATLHSFAQATSYRADGDHADDRSGKAFDETSHSWYYLSDVELRGDRPRGSTVVAFGDSITDGTASTVDADARYPDALADRLRAAGRDRPVLNAGIAGNRLLTDSAYFGERALARFERDALAKPRVGSVVLLIGVNDIGFSEAPDVPFFQPPTERSAKELIAGYDKLVDRAHARGVRVTGATIMPYKGADYHTAEGEAKRQAINEWIRTSGVFDAVVDLAAATADPDDPLTLNPAYDSGDHLHPNDAGYRAMAAAVDLGAL